MLDVFLYVFSFSTVFEAMHIIAALSEIGLQFPIQVSDIASPQAKERRSS